MPQQPKERRRSRRAENVKGKLDCLAPSARVRDISLAGVYLLFPDPPPVGEDLKLRLSLRSGEQFEALGVVRRLELGRGAAVEFTELSPSARASLVQFLSLQFTETGTEGKN